MTEEKKQPNPFSMFMPMIAMVAVIFVFKYLPPIFTPAIYAVGGFGGKYPVLTIFLAAVLTGLVSTAVRHLFTDYVATAKMQHIMSAFQKEMRDAQVKKDVGRMKKLQGYQQELMLMQTSAQSSQMKSMLPTMLVSLPIFAGLLGIISGYSDPFNNGALVAPLLDPSAMTIQAPWGPVVLSGAGNSKFLFPNYIWLYMVFSFIIGSVFGRAFRLAKFNKYTPKEGPEEIELKTAATAAPAPLAPLSSDSDAYMNMSDSKFKKWAGKQLKEKGYAVYRDASVGGVHVDLIAAGDDKVYGFVCRSLPGRLDIRSKTYRDEAGMERFDVSDEIAKIASAMSASIPNAMLSVKLLFNGTLRNPDDMVLHYKNLEEFPMCEKPMAIDSIGKQAEDSADE